jgi:tRNA-specific 2-thiouridylase
VSQEQLGYALFPIGDLTKPEVRRIANEQGLATAHRKDSQGICFVGKVHLPTFLQQKLAAKKGWIVEIPKDFNNKSGKVAFSRNNISDYALQLVSEPNHYEPNSGRIIGDHNGAHFFTIGQRKGINVGGYKEPLFVLGTDTINNLLFVGEGQSHPGLYRKGLFIRNEDVHWIRRDLIMKDDESRHYNVRIRYRQPLQKAGLYKRKEGIYIIFNKLQRGIAPGQFAAWYNGDEVIGSGVINR